MANVRRSRGAADVTEFSPDYAFRLPQWRKIRDVLEGEDQVKQRQKLYLPQPRGMQTIDYISYLERASFFGAADRTLRGLVGLVFRVPPVVELPGRLAARVEALTPEGFSAEQALREAVRELLSLGRYGLLVDVPRRAAPAPQVVPYVATYRAEDIFNWEELFDEAVGERLVTRVLLREEPATADDETRVIIRELFLDSETGAYTVQLWEEIESERERRGETGASHVDQQILSGSFARLGEPVVPLRNGEPLRRIPFWFLNPFDLRARTDKPPMLDLVNVNLAHYRNSADYEHSLFLTSQPTPYIFGINDEDVPKAIGSSQIWHSTNSDVAVGMLEFTGAGIGALERALERKETLMGILGARIISDPGRRTRISSETVRLESREETSILVAAVRTAQDGFAKTLRFAAEWALESPDAIVARLNQDFIEVRLEPQELEKLVLAWQSGAISRPTLHENLQRGEIIDPHRTLEEELELIRGEEGVELVAPRRAAPEEETEEETDDAEEGDDGAASAGE